MKRLLVPAAAFGLLCAGAFAADLPMMEASGLNPQPLPPVAEEEMSADEAMAPADEAMAPAEEAAQPAQAEAAPDTRVAISNGTQASIVELHISPRGTENWQTGVLQGRSIAPGSSVTVNFANDAGICEFDVRAVFSDGGSQLIEGLNACQVGEVALRV